MPGTTGSLRETRPKEHFTALRMALLNSSPSETVKNNRMKRAGGLALRLLLFLDELVLMIFLCLSCIEIIALTVDGDEAGEILDLKAADGFCAEILITEDFRLFN